ncbi:MAG: hypothetical protein A2Y33_14105 [Spirochaetes bacterium GWF1_51_8]|nr:MAG: hypothetical protein A2Y33_14105 [Spirochaetes bacterium GWF1_51_8]
MTRKKALKWNGHEVFYQIFPETFAIGGGADIHSKAAKGFYPPDAILRAWNELPSGDTESREFWGGDLAGVAEKLDYIAGLGADTILLTSVFDSPSNHRYNARDYRKIAPGLGTLDDFDWLIDSAHAKGIKIVFDIVLNHFSSDHPWFREALADQNSKYRDYFRFHDGGYDCWQGHPSVPEWNLSNPAVRDELYRGKDSVLVFWLARGIDGIRLDCANDLGTGICGEICSIVKEFDPDVRVYGEVFPYAAPFAEVLDGVQSYFLTGAIDSYLLDEIGTGDFLRALGRVWNGFPSRKLFQSLTITGSHDIPRAMTRYGSDNERVMLAIALQFTLPGTPVIYYGEEAGMTGSYDPVNRTPMMWEKADAPEGFAGFYRKMAALREVRREWREGDLTVMSVDDGCALFFRSTDEPGEFSLVAVNPGHEKKAFRAHIPYPYLYDSIKLKDLLTGRELSTRMGYADIEIGGKEACIWVPEPDYIRNYHFYKKNELK